MIDAPPPNLHEIGTALYMIVERGGHATPPKRNWRIVGQKTAVRNPITVQSGVTFGIPAKPKGCKATYSTLTPAAKRLGVKAIVTYWCSK